MRWLKNALIDLAVTVVIVIATIWGPSWAVWIVLVYTPLMLVIKIAVLTSDWTRQMRRSDHDVPAWFYHVLYAVNTILLLSHGWWFTGAQWIGIWVLSVLNDRQTQPAE